MKNIIFTLAFCVVATLSFAQNTYLKITSSDTTSISYPPQTQFELKNKHGYIVLKNNNTPSTFIIDEPYTLTIFPTYKKENDVYQLDEGKLELKEAKPYENANKHDYVSNGVVAHFTVTNSKAIEGSKNIMFYLSNGIVFKYVDGKYNAYLHNQENYLNIEGKYLIESEMGTLKLSFNPKNAEVWWVFDL